MASQGLAILADAMRAAEIGRIEMPSLLFVADKRPEAVAKLMAVERGRDRCQERRAPTGGKGSAARM